MNQHDGNPWTNLDDGDKDGTQHKIVDGTKHTIVDATQHKIVDKTEHKIVDRTQHKVVLNSRKVLQSLILRLILWDPGHFLGNGTFYPLGTISSSGNRTNYPLGIGPLSSGNRIIYPLGFGKSTGKQDMGNRTRYPLGFGPIILWESDHLSSGIRDIHWETGHGKRYTLSSGIQTTYPLRNILWESGIWESIFNPKSQPKTHLRSQLKLIHPTNLFQIVHRSGILGI